MRCAHRMLLELCASRRGSAVKPLSAAGRDIEQWKAWWQSPWHGALSYPNAIQSSDTFWPALVGILCYVFIGNGKEYGLFRRVKGGMWGFTFEGLCRSTARLPWASRGFSFSSRVGQCDRRNEPMPSIRRVNRETGRIRSAVMSAAGGSWHNEG